MKQEFWKDWKRKTKLEINAIKSLKVAKNIILRNIPKKKIITIYAGGSFIRREMNKRSDVDTYTIVNDSRLLKKFEKLEEKYHGICKPKISLRAFSIWELRNNKRYLSSNKPKASPSRFIKKIKEYKLIYGKPLNPEDYAFRSDKEDLEKQISAFNRLFIPLYEEGKMAFSDLSKQVFWLAELEEKVKGKHPPYSWKKLAKSIKDKNHIIHEALIFRKKIIKDKKKRARFIIKLKRYLNNLEKKLKR